MKNFISFILLCLIIGFAYSQTNSTIDIYDEIYPILENMQMRGLCPNFSVAKPYSKSMIYSAVEDILEKRSQLTVVEFDFLKDWLEENSTKNEDRYLELKRLQKKNLLVSEGENVFSEERIAEIEEKYPYKDKKIPHFRRTLLNEKFPVSVQFDLGFETIASGGLYTKSEFNQWSIDIMPSFNFIGDLGKNISYKITGTVDLCRTPLYTPNGVDYFIGYAWYEDGVSKFLNGEKDSSNMNYPEPKRRTIKKMLNTSFLPYKYRKFWDGQMYLLKQLDASGLEGWPQSFGVSGSITAEINASFFDNKVRIGMGRISREWASMDSGSSLVFNRNSRPFFAGDISIDIFSWLKYSMLTGVLEYPNQDYISEDSWISSGRTDDAKFYQNLFSLNMIELDFKYLHLDMGSSVVWPKRNELGYIFPLVSFVEYQNHIGDYDNLALFGNIKVRKPGLGSVWASLYLDEINGLNNNPLTSTRAMFAGQLGVKAVFPWLPFATVLMRYTKVEPYCYTHHSINYTPWYNHYISENYTNNGYSLGYYLEPNSDETTLIFEAKPLKNLSANFQYQFIRHGADYGSQQVPGSSLYSEMSPYNRNELEKYFLRDGAYNWSHIVSLGACVEFRKAKIPLQIYGTLGFLYSYYTLIDQNTYDLRSKYGNNGNSGADADTAYHFVDNDEYPVQCGSILTLGVKLWKF